MSVRQAMKSSPGPLLTGSARWDQVLGFVSEPITVAIAVSGLVTLCRALSGGAPMLEVILAFVSALATAGVMTWNIQWLEARYPNFARGWQYGRNLWRCPTDALLTLIVGVAVLIVIFPLGVLVMKLCALLGWLGWLLALLIVYSVGHGVRGMIANYPRRGEPLP